MGPHVQVNHPPDVGAQILPPTIPRNPKLVVVTEPLERADVDLRAPYARYRGQSFWHMIECAGLQRGQIALIPATLSAPRNRFSDPQIAHLVQLNAVRVLKQLSTIRGQYGDLPTLLCGKWPLRLLTGFRNIQVARGFVWRAPEVTYKEVMSARRAYGRATVPQSPLTKAGKPRKQRVTKCRKLQASPDELYRDAEILEWRMALTGLPLFPILGPRVTGDAPLWRPIDALDIARAARWPWEPADEGPHANV